MTAMAADAPSAPRAPSRSFVAGCTAWWILNSALCVLMNKYILSPAHLGFNFPVTLAVLHMLAAAAATAVLVQCTPGGRQHVPPRGAATAAFYTKLAGIAGLFGAVLILANSAFMFLSVPSIQMLKAGSAATTFCVGLLFGTEAYSHRSALKVAVVGAGVLIASYGDVKANLLGVCLQVGSIVSDALRCTLLQLAMQRSEFKLSPVGTLYYVAPMAAGILSVPAVALELGRMLRHDTAVPWLWLLASCAAASSLNLVVFTLIGKTSALTTSITGPLKEWVCILTSMVLLGSPVTGQQWFGYAIAVLGISWYQYEKFVRPPSLTSPRGKGAGGGSGGGVAAAYPKLLPVSQQDAATIKAQQSL